MENKKLTPEEIAQIFRDRLIYVLPPKVVNEELFKEVLSGMVREYGEQLLKSEQERIEKQVKSLTTDKLHEPAEAFRIAGKIEGMKMAIENIRQTLKSK